MKLDILEKLKKEYKSLLSGMGIGQKPTNFIGLDMGSKYFRAVRIKKTGDKFIKGPATDQFFIAFFKIALHYRWANSIKPGAIKEFSESGFSGAMA